MKQNTKGMLGALEIAMIVVAVGILGFVGWRVISSDKSQVTEDTVTDETTDVEDSSTETFVSTSTGAMLTYPNDWTLENETETICSDNRNNECSEFVNIKSDDGVMVRFVEQAGELDTQDACGIQAPCYEQIIHQWIPVDSEKYSDLNIVVMGDVPEEGESTGCPTIELFSPISDETIFEVGEKIPNNKALGIPFEDFYFNLFVAYELDENGQTLNRFSDLSYDECVQLDSVREAIDILASFEI